MNLGILPNLTKDYILSKVSQEQIFEHYLPIKVTVGSLIKSPLRNDKNPTASFYYSQNGKLRFRDFGGNFWGDCFDLAALYENLNSSNKKDFNILLDKLARIFKIHKYENNEINPVISGSTLSIKEAVINFSGRKKIEVKAREFNEIDARFWQQGNITKKFLKKFKVFACEYIWLNNNLIYTFNSKDPAYAYYFSKGEFKIYFPFRKEYRFISNTSVIQGKNLIEPAEYGIITKSYKDVIALNTFNIQSFAPSSESVLISKDEWFKIKWTCNHWFSLMDYDLQGIKMAIKLRKYYNIQPLFFTKEDNFKSDNKDKTITKKGLIYNQYKDFNVKDFFEFVSKYGKQETEKLITEVIEQYQNNFDILDNQINTNLYFLKNGNSKL